MGVISQAQAIWVNELAASFSENSLKHTLKTLTKIQDTLELMKG